MERLVTVKDICERYSCSGKTARKYLRQMFHYESPLTAPKWAMEEWELSRASDPGKTRTIVPRKRG